MKAKPKVDSKAQDTTVKDTKAKEEANDLKKPKDCPKQLDRVFLERFKRQPEEWLAYCDDLAARLCVCPVLPGNATFNIETSSAAACLHVLDNPNPILAVFDRRDMWGKILPMFAALRAMLGHRSMINRTKHLLSKLASTYMFQKLARTSTMDFVWAQLDLSIDETLELSSHVVAIALEAKGGLSGLCLAFAR
jgi:hypothetical protein